LKSRGETTEEKNDQEDAVHNIDPVLLGDEAPTNIRIKVNTTSNEIVSVSGDPMMASVADIVAEGDAFINSSIWGDDTGEDDDNGNPSSSSVIAGNNKKNSDNSTRPEEDGSASLDACLKDTQPVDNDRKEGGDKTASSVASDQKERGEKDDDDSDDQSHFSKSSSSASASASGASASGAKNVKTTASAARGSGNKVRKLLDYSDATTGDDGKKNVFQICGVVGSGDKSSIPAPAMWDGGGDDGSSSARDDNDGDDEDEGNGSDDAKEVDASDSEEETTKKKGAWAAKRKTSILDYLDSDSGEEDDDDDDDDDDPSYKGKDDESDDDDDDDNDEDDGILSVDNKEEDSPAKKRGSPSQVKSSSSQPLPTSSPRSLLNATVAITSGLFEGKSGTIVQARRGWYTLDRKSGVSTAVRARDFEVIQYADDGDEEEDVDKEEEEEDDESNSDSDDDDDNDNLTGASIKITSGKFKGLTGTINERQRYRHVEIQTDPPMPPVLISNVMLLSRYKHESKAHPQYQKNTDCCHGTAEELSKKYMGNKVKVTKGEFFSIVGVVSKVIVGDWYITDNSRITNAYQSQRFEVVKYPPGWNEKKSKKKKKGNRRDEGGVTGGTGDAAAAAAAKDMEGKEKNAKEEKGKNAKDKKEVIVKEEITSNSSRDVDADDTVPAATPAIAASNQEILQTNTTASITTVPSEEHQRSLIGATIRIKKGRYRGITGVINEEQSIRRLQLDSVPTPLGFEDVAVLQYAPEVLKTGSFDSTNEDEFAKKYQKYVGARVRVTQSSEYEGMEGKVIRVIVLGDWYITDNPLLPMAFPMHKFDVVRYADDDTDDDASGDDGEEEEYEEESESNEAAGEEIDEDRGDGKKRPGKDTVTEEEKEGKVSAKSNEEEESDDNDKESDNNDNSQRKKEGAETKEEDVKMKEVDNEEDKGDDNDDDWGSNNNNNNGFTDYNPESPTDQNIMDVDKEGDAAASSEGDTKEARGLDAADADDEQKNDAIIDNKDAATEDTLSVNNENEKDVGTQEDGAKEGSAKNDNEEQDQANDGKATLRNQQDAQGTKSPVRPASTSTTPPTPDTDHPLIGATIYIYTGPYAGLSGKLLMTQQRGWWTIDNPKLTGKKIQCHKCKLVDDGMVDLDTVKGWYARKGIVDKMPKVKKVKGMDFNEGEAAKEEEEEQKREATSSTSNTGDTELKRKIATTDFTGNGSISQKRRKAVGVIELLPHQQRVSSNYNAVWGKQVSSIIPQRQQQEDNHGRKQRSLQRPKIMRDGALPSTPALNPILLQASNNRDKDQQQRVKVELLLPTSLHHLSPDTRIEIFNRKTGRIMRGTDAILLSDLARALMNHAEYEPIIPPSPTTAATGKGSITSRIGRSGPNVRVSSNIIPQTRVRASRVEGRDVLVTGGEYRGLSGTIDSCIPGGWYLVSSLFNDNLDVVISSQNLELVREKTAFSNNSSSSEGQRAIKNRIHLKAAKLRLEAFAEERTKLEKDHHAALGGGSHRDIKATRIHLKKLDEEVVKANNLVADLQKATDRKMKGAD